MLPESTDSCSWGPSDHDVFLEVSPAFTSHDREKPGGAFCLRVKPSLPFYWHFLSWFLPLGCPKRLAAELPVPGPVPSDAWHCLAEGHSATFFLLPCPHSFFTKRDTMADSQMWVGDIARSISFGGSAAHSDDSCSLRLLRIMGPPFLGINKVGRQ